MKLFTTWRVRLRPDPLIILAAVFTGSVLSLSAQTNSAPAPNTTATAQPAANASLQPDPFSDPLIKQIQARHEKAVYGDTKETKALTADLEKWTKEQPTNYLLEAYLGSVYTLDSRDAWIGPGKLDFLRKGGKCLDAAVAAAPDNPAVRLIRAIDYYQLPFFFGKGKAANDDFHYLVKQLNGEIKMPYALEPETRQGMYYYAGLSFKHSSEVPQAKDAWERGLKLAPNSTMAPKIETELEKLR